MHSMNASAACDHVEEDRTVTNSKSPTGAGTLVEGDSEAPKSATTITSDGTTVTLPSSRCPQAVGGSQAAGLWSKRGNQPWCGRDAFPAGAVPEVLSKKVIWARPLPSYQIPNKFWQLEAATKRGYDSQMHKGCRQLLKARFGQRALRLDHKNYRQSFHELLYIEELQMRYDIGAYDLAVFKPLQRVCRGLYDVRVPGLAERRPSVQNGDVVYLRSWLGCYKCYVHAVRQCHLRISLHQSFQNIPPFQIQFGFARTTLRAMHRALDTCDLSILGLKGVRDCPAGVPTIPEEQGGFTECEASASATEWGWLSKVASSLKWFTTGRDNNSGKPPLSYLQGDVCWNAEQLQVIRLIAEIEDRGTVLVWGPPGTGKSTVLCQAIWTLLHSSVPSEGTKVLATAPSNAAADVLCQKLARLGVSTQDMLRLNAQGRNFMDIPDEVIPFCNAREQTDTTTSTSSADDMRFVIPSWQMLLGFRVIICTCSASSYILSRRPLDQKGCFSHVLVDEAAEALEPEALIPLCSLCPPESGRGKVVLAGDFRQLGPIVRSPVARERGLEVSILDRLALTAEACTSTDSASNASLQGVKLLETFRSHPSILQLYNKAIYGGDLRPSCGSESYDLEAWPGCSDSKGVKHPVVFHHLEGRQGQDPDSPSWYNLDEAEVVKAYIMSLLRFGVKSAEIGVISPYRKQCQKVRELLRSQAPLLEIGTPETFQGREKRAIIVSTVRSSAKDAKRFNLGFVSSSRRTNVSISRARSLLIVIGNLQLLERDATWKVVLGIARDMSAVVGEESKPSNHMTSNCRGSAGASGRDSQLQNAEAADFRGSNSEVEGNVSDQRSEAGSDWTQISQLTSVASSWEVVSGQREGSAEEGPQQEAAFDGTWRDTCGVMGVASGGTFKWAHVVDDESRGSKFLVDSNLIKLDFMGDCLSGLLDRDRVLWESGDVWWRAKCSHPETAEEERCCDSQSVESWAVMDSSERCADAEELWRDYGEAA